MMNLGIVQIQPERILIMSSSEELQHAPNQMTRPHTRMKSMML